MVSSTNSSRRSVLSRCCRTLKVWNTRAHLGRAAVPICHILRVNRWRGQRATGSAPFRSASQSCAMWGEALPNAARHHRRRTATENSHQRARGGGSSANMQWQCAAKHELAAAEVRISLAPLRKAARRRLILRERRWDGIYVKGKGRGGGQKRPGAVGQTTPYQ